MIYCLILSALSTSLGITDLSKASFLIVPIRICIFDTSIRSVSCNVAWSFSGFSKNKYQKPCWAACPVSQFSTCLLNFHDYFVLDSYVWFIIPENQIIFLQVLTHRSGSVSMLSLIYSEVLKMLRMWGILNFDVEIFFPRDFHSSPRGYLKQKSKESDQSHIMTSQSLLVEVIILLF